MHIPASSGIRNVAWAVGTDCIGSEAEGIRTAEVAHRTYCSSDPKTPRANSDKS
jgi:hypothetical protein